MHAGAIEAINGAEVMGILVCSGAARDAPTRSVPAARLYGDYARMLMADDADVLRVVLPNHKHSDAAVSALKAGKHVLLEKPLGLSVARCDAEIAASSRTGRLVAVNPRTARLQAMGRRVCLGVARGTRPVAAAVSVTPETAVDRFLPLDTPCELQLLCAPARSPQW